MSGSHERGCVEAAPGGVCALGVVLVASLVDAPLIAPPPAAPRHQHAASPRDCVPPGRPVGPLPGFSRS